LISVCIQRVNSGASAKQIAAEIKALIAIFPNTSP
jgi:hypothetical protein